MSPKVRDWIDSVLDLQYLVVVKATTSMMRGEQPVTLDLVELATGEVRCSTTVIGKADASLGTDYYEVRRTRTGEHVRNEAHDRYAQAMQVDLLGKLGEALRDKLHIKMRGFCQSAE